MIKQVLYKLWFWLVFAVVIVLLTLIYLLKPYPKNDDNSIRPNGTISNLSNQPSNQKTYWKQSRGGWEKVGTPPACPEPLVLSIGDISKATSVPYPGQMRSVGYEPTAGFRFDKTPDNATEIKAPLDGEIVAASRFISGGSIQYVFDIMSPCGIMNRFDHLLEIPAKLQSIADKLPEPKENRALHPSALRWQS